MKNLLEKYTMHKKSNPSEGDLCKLVEKDASEIGIQISENKILTMKEERFKDNIKNKVRIAALKNLLKQKDSHSKMDNLSYKKLEIQAYMQSPLFDTESAEMLLALRTRTVRGVKNDFRGMIQDVACPLGCGNSDTLPNILTCPVLQDQLKSETVAMIYLAMILESRSK